MKFPNTSQSYKRTGPFFNKFFYAENCDCDSTKAENTLRSQKEKQNVVFIELVLGRIQPVARHREETRGNPSPSRMSIYYKDFASYNKDYIQSFLIGSLIILCLNDFKRIAFQGELNFINKVNVAVTDIGSVKCLDPGPCYSDEGASERERGRCPRQAQPLLNPPRGQSVETQQPWRQLVPGQLLLTQEVLPQSPASYRVRALYQIVVYIIVHQQCE